MQQHPDKQQQLPQHLCTANASTLCPLLLNSDIFSSNGGKNRHVELRWNSKIVSLPLWRRTMCSKITLEWPRHCAACSMKSVPRACAFKPPTADFNLRFLPSSSQNPASSHLWRPCTEQAKNSHGLCHLWSANNKRSLPRILRIK